MLDPYVLSITVNDPYAHTACADLLSRCHLFYYLTFVLMLHVSQVPAESLTAITGPS